MGFRRYKATVTYLSSVLAPKRQLSEVTIEFASSESIKGAEDLAFLKGLASVPANSMITRIALVELVRPAVAA
jgi:hypothetical protein